MTTITKAKDSLFDERQALLSANKKLEHLVDSMENVDTNAIEDIRQLLKASNEEREAALEEVRRLRGLEIRHSNQLKQDRAEVLRVRSTLEGVEKELLESNAQATKTQDTHNSEKALHLRAIADKEHKLRLISDLKEKETGDLKGRLEVALKNLESSRKEAREKSEQLITQAEDAQRNLEKAVSSSVKLTVIAPNVNVIIGEDKVKVKARLNTDALKVFMDELLDEFSTLYRTRDAGVEGSYAPDGKTPVQPWLESVLGKMQVSIEQHVAAATETPR